MAKKSDDSLLNRIQHINGVPVNDLVCSICLDLLWKPVECIGCHNSYCEECINSWLQIKPQTCPHCQNYGKGKLHPTMTKQLSRLQIKCIHRKNGCSEVITYEALEKHEDSCGYRHGQCSGCRVRILSKDLPTHESKCGSIQWTCPDCQFTCIRDAAPSHTDKICFQQQLSQREAGMMAQIQEQDTTIQSVKRQLDEISSRISEVTHKLEQIMNKLQEQQTTNQNLNQRLNEISSLIPIVKSIPPYPARWQTNGVTVAGGHGRGNRADQLNQPVALFVDEDQTVYIAEYCNHRIMGWKAGTMTGEVLACGKVDGNRLEQLNGPVDVIVDRETDSLLICDVQNRRVKRWPRRPSSHRQPEIFIDNIRCSGLTMDDQGSLYISDVEKCEVRRYDKNGDKKGTVVAGGHERGDNLNQLNEPSYLFVDAQSTVYVSDYNNHRVMKWMKGAEEGIVVAGGNGQGGNLAQLSSPRGVWVDGYGHVYVVEWGNHRVTRWEKGAKQGTLIVGGHGYGKQANQLTDPSGLFFDLHGHLYVTDIGNDRVQRFSLC